MTPIITLYDIASSLDKQAWSPSTWRIRYSLNYKGISYKTVWVDYPDIEEVCKSIGATPTMKWPDGRPRYTLPVIHDHSTGSVISDGPLIAEYLDNTYPSTPKLYPPGYKTLIYAFNDAHATATAPISMFSLFASYKILTPRGQEFYRATREQRLKKKLENVTPTGEDRAIEWAKVEEGYGKIDSWLKKSRGQLVIEDTISFADITLTADLQWMRKIFGDDSVEWQDIKRWHNGRWEALLATFEKYQAEE